MRARADAFVPLDQPPELPRSLRGRLVRDEHHPAGWVPALGAEPEARQRWREWCEVWLARWPLDEWREVLDALELAAVGRDDDLYLPEAIDDLRQGGCSLGAAGVVEVIAALGELRDQVETGAVPTWALTSDGRSPQWLVDRDAVLAANSTLTLRVRAGVGVELVGAAAEPMQVRSWHVAQPGRVTVHGAAGDATITGDDTLVFDAAAPRRATVRVEHGGQKAWAATFEGLAAAAATVARLPSRRLHIATGW